MTKNASKLRRMIACKRAVSPIIATILLLGIIVVGVSFVYFLGIPIINRMQDTAMIRRVENSMLLLGDNILTVVNEGHGSERITQFSYGKGMFLIYPNFVSVKFQMLNNSQLRDEYPQTLEKIEYSVDTSSDIIAHDSRLYVRGWHWNTVNGTQGEPNSDIDRIIIDRIGSAQVNLLLDFRPRLYYYNDTNGNVHVTISIVKLAVNPYLRSGIGAGTFRISTHNQNVTITDYSYTFSRTTIFGIRASFTQAGTEQTEQAFSCLMRAGKSATVEFIMTEVGVGIL